MKSTAVVTVARFVSLLFGGIFAGFLVTALIVELTLRRYDASVYTQVRHIELAHLDELASATLLPTLIATGVLVIVAIRTRGNSFWLTLTALILLIAVLVTTLIFNLPINSDQVDWNVQSPPANWASVRDRWQIAHAVRTGAAVLAFGFLSAASLVRPPKSRATVGNHGRTISTGAVS